MLEGHDRRSEGKMRAEVERDWRARGYSCGLWTDPPGQRWEDFIRGVDELVVLLEGKAERLGVGEEILIPARAVHGVRSIGTKTSRWLYGYKER